MKFKLLLLILVCAGLSFGAQRVVLCEEAYSEG